MRSVPIPRIRSATAKLLRLWVAPWRHGGVRRQLGWTLVELVLVMAIMGTLLGIAVPKLQDRIDQARVARAILDIESIQSDLAGLEMLGEGLPETLAETGRGNLDDPWGNPYQYLKFPPGPGKPKGARKDRFLVPINTTYDLYSMGKDGASKPPLTAQASRDDIVRANDGGFVGLAVKY